MSNYLQRMALGALKPSGVIRPVLNPVDSTWQPRPANNSPAIEENILSANNPVHREELNLEISSKSPVPTHVSSDFPRLLPTFAEANKADRGHDETVEHPPTQPMVARETTHVQLSEDEETRQASRSVVVERIKLEKALSRQAFGEEPAKPPQVPASQPEAVERVVERLMTDSPESHPRSPLPGSQATVVTATADLGKMQKRTPVSRQSGHSVREPDEIQIHIGRIEVTAVPPPAAGKAAVRPQRSTSSLDEYLRQRDRRVA